MKELFEKVFDVVIRNYSQCTSRVWLFEGETGLERVKWGFRKNQFSPALHCRWKLLRSCKFSHIQGHTHSDKLERKVTCSMEHSSSPSPSSRQIPIVTQWFALTKSGQAYCDETLVYGLKCCEKQNHKEHATLFLSIDSFRKRHLASLPCFGCAGPTRSTATADFRRYYCWFTSTLGARSLCNPVKLAAAV